MKAMITGSFDPITKGHIDILKRSAHLFDALYIALLVNEKKQTLFTLEERIAMVDTVVSQLGLDNCTVISDNGLAVDCAQRYGCKVLIRGVRNAGDMEYEMSQAAINRMLNPTIETLFLPALPETVYVSSSAAKTIASYHGALDHFVTESVEKALRQKYRESGQ